MRVRVLAVGRLKRGPERELVERFAGRVRRAGPVAGLSALDIVELPEARAADARSRKAEEARALLSRIPDTRCAVVALDEGGALLDSAAFAKLLADNRDDGLQDMVFVVGGPDGLGRDVLDRAKSRVALGRLTWPHQIVRVLLLEQIYRSVTLLNNHPYHRT